MVVTIRSDRALDVERARFLRIVDEVSPAVWNDLRDAALPLLAEGRLLAATHEIAAWQRKRGFGEWVIDYALDRLQRLRTRPARGGLRGAAQSAGWLPLEDPPAPVLPALRLDRWTDSPDDDAVAFRKRAKRYERAADAFGAAIVGTVQLASDRDLGRLARWVLGKSPGSIASLELSRRSLGPANGERRARSIKTRTEDVRDVVKRLAKRIGLVRPPGRPGAPRKDGIPG
jgi:hypothetical protein